MYGKKELANVGLKMEDKRNLVILTVSEPLPPSQSSPTHLHDQKTNIETLWLRSNSSVEMKMFTHKSLKKMSENNFCL